MKLGWAFFALAVVVVLAYALNRGVYVGSRVYLYKETTYGKDCNPFRHPYGERLCRFYSRRSQ